MQKYQDIQNTDLTLKNQFAQSWLNGDYSAAFSVIRNNPQLDSKAFVATCFSNIVDALIILENYYYNNVTQEMQLLLTEYNEGINQFINRRQWDAEEDYKVGNFVLYGSTLADSQIYLCIQDNSGVLPTDTDYWAYIGLTGEKGDSAVIVDFKYNWNSTTSYNKNDVVMYDKNIYYALRPNINKTPNTNPQDWGFFMKIPQIKIFISPTPPSSELIYDGLVWWQIIQNV